MLIDLGFLYDIQDAQAGIVLQTKKFKVSICRKYLKISIFLPK